MKLALLALGAPLLLATGCGVQQWARAGFNGTYDTRTLFSGTYVAEGGSITLQQQGNQVTGNARIKGAVIALEGVADGSQLRGTFRSTEGKSYAGSFTAQVSAGGLQMAVDGGQSIYLTRASAPPATEQPTAAAPARTFTPHPVITGVAAGAATAHKIGQKPPAPASAAASASPYRDELDGWEVRTPAGWRHAQKANALVFGADTEAGLVVVSYFHGVSYDQMIAGADAAFRKLGATPIGPARTHKLAGGRGLITEVTGVGSDGIEIHGRSIGIAGPSGVLSVFGITTKEKFEALRKRVDQIAQSARFHTPTQSPAMKYLGGTWWHHHSVGDATNGASFERTIELCADGTFYDSSTSDISLRAENKDQTSPNFGSYTQAGKDSQSAAHGRWNATGDDFQGSLRLAFANGNVEQRRYVFKIRRGADIELDGRWYGWLKEKRRCR